MWWHVAFVFCAFFLPLALPERRYERPTIYDWEAEDACN